MPNRALPGQNLKLEDSLTEVGWCLIGVELMSLTAIDQLSPLPPYIRHATVQRLWQCLALHPSLSYTCQFMSEYASIIRQEPAACTCGAMGWLVYLRVRAQLATTREIKWSVRTKIWERNQLLKIVSVISWQNGYACLVHKLFPLLWTIY